MNKTIQIFFTLLLLASVSTTAHAQDTIFGKYKGILKQKGETPFTAPFALTFSKSLKLTLKYQVSGTAVLDVTQFRSDGTYTGFAKAGGTILAVGDGKWKLVGRTIRFSGSLVSLGKNYKTTGFLRFRANKIIALNNSSQGSVRYTAVK